MRQRARHARTAHRALPAATWGARWVMCGGYGSVWSKSKSKIRMTHVSLGDKMRTAKVMHYGYSIHGTHVWTYE